MRMIRLLHEFFVCLFVFRCECNVCYCSGIWDVELKAASFWNKTSHKIDACHPREDFVWGVELMMVGQEFCLVTLFAALAYQHDFDMQYSFFLSR